MDTCPTHFYRYRSLCGASAAYVERTICHDELYFPKPSSFNDPFDCRPSFRFEATDEEMIAYYERLLKKFMPQLNDAERRKEAEAKLSDPERSPRNPQTVQRIKELHTEEITEKIGVLCLSAVNDDILMWSHYADSHKGICLEFDGYSAFFARTQQVTYPPLRPQTNPFRQESREMMEAALLTKSAHWAYEKEWRIVEYEKGPGIYQFPSEALTSVILGAQMSQEDTEKVLRWVEARKKPLKLYRAVPCETTFSLKIEIVPNEIST